MSIASQVLDFYDDTTRVGLTKVASPAGLGKLRFEALDADALSDLENDQFGLVILTKQGQALRKFPLHDPAHVWLASEYFAQNHTKLAKPAATIAAHHIKVAAGAYDMPVSSAVEAAAASYPGDYEGNTFVEGSEVHWNLTQPIEKTAAAAPDDTYALVYQDASGNVMRKYAMPNVESLDQAIGWFEKNASKLAPEHRPRMAKAIVKRAAALGVDLGDYSNCPGVYKYAAGQWNPHVVAHLEQRQSLLPRDEKARDILTKLAEHIGEEHPERFAQALDAFDQKTGLSRYYGRGLEDAYSSSLGIAKQASWSDEIDGDTITETDLKKAAARPNFGKYFGTKVAEAFAKDPVAIFESMPAPDKVVIAQIARGEA